MTKGEKIFTVCSVAFILVAGGTTAAVIANSGRASQSSEYEISEAVRINADNLLTELKVGKYYLTSGTDEEYIEVYSDKTICMFGWVLPKEEMEERRTNYELFTTRQPYKLSDMVKSITLGGTPIGYGYTDENCITFSTPDKGELKYIYRNE